MPKGTVAEAQSPATEYARSVVRGDVVAGKLVRLACQRHLDDLNNGAARGLWFDEESAELALDFFDHLSPSKGEWAGRPLQLALWQKFIIGSIFGWKRADGTRRYRYAYIEVGRKNGKSTMCAGIALLLAFYDGEPGAEVYSAATKREQAKIVFEEAKRMVKAGPKKMRDKITVFVGNLHNDRTGSKFEPLGADSDSMDGLNIHAAIIDELHAHKTRAMWDVLDTATGSRRQPLIFVITTAGYDRNSICWEQRDYGAKVVEGIIADDDHFAYIATIDDGDDYRDEAIWPKANPNLDISVKREKIAAAVNKASQVPGELNAVLRLHFDVWTEAASRWLDMATWDRGGDPIDADALAGRKCFAGLDLARVHDLSALVKLFPPAEPGECWKALCRFWIPEEDIQRRSFHDRVPYDVWAREGLIETTPGNTTDYGFIAKAILEDHAKYNIVEVAYDRTFAGEIIQTLMNENVVMVPFGQGFLSMAAPTAELERLVIAGELQHGGNPVLRWNASNAVIVQDAAANMKIDKARSVERVDGMVALAEAIGRAIVHNAADGRSVYEDHGLRSI